MMTIVTKKVCFLPTKSPKRPNKIAPNGRTIKPAAKANKAKMNAVLGSVPAKNCLAIIAASEPYK